MTINEKLEPIISYLISIDRNAEKGWYELKMGIQNAWTYSDDDKIQCVLIQEFEEGKIIQLVPKNDDVIVDDLVTYASALITLNEEIAEKERKLNDEIERLKREYAEEMERAKAELVEKRMKQNELLDKLKQEKETLTTQK